MIRIAYLLLTAASVLGTLFGQEKPVFTVESDQEAPFSDRELSVQIADNDLLSGASFTSNLPLPKGHPKKLTDGKGHEFIQGDGTFGQDSTGDWIVIFSNLRIAELQEIRVFSSNRDGRSQQDYDVAYSGDRGKTFHSLAKNVIAGQRGGYNLTRVPVKAQKVTDLRFTFRNPSERQRAASKLHSALYEIDAIGIPIETPSLTEIRNKGRQQSHFLSGQFTIADNAEIPEPDLAGFRKKIQPMLEKACVQCHGPDKQKGKFRVDTLNPNLHTGGDVEWWLEVLDVASNYEMPPEDDVDLADLDRARLIDWLSQEVQVASRVRRAEAEHTSFRRMTRYEYTNTLQDLLGLPYEFGADLPPETASEDGFRNSSEMLTVSAMQFETYRNLARTALEKATVHGERPAPQWITPDFGAAADAFLANIENQVERVLKNAEKSGKKPNIEGIRRRAKPQPFANWFRFAEDGRRMAAGPIPRGQPLAERPEFSAKPDVQLVLNSIKHGGRIRTHRVPFDLGRELPDEGNLRVRVWASRDAAQNLRIPVLQLTFGFGTGNNGVVEFPVGESQPIEALSDKPKMYEWIVPLSEIQRNPLRGEVVPGRSSEERISLTNRFPTPEGVKFEDLPAIHVDHVEITWPFYEEWPPESHRRIFPETDTTTDESIRARQVLKKFLTRAWRQPVEDEELARMMTLFTEFRPQCDTFQEAIIEVLAVGLASPRFLYLVQKSEPKETLTSYELATRLSYFLWCGMPDDELMKLAETGELLKPEVLNAQTNRMLRDPRSHRFAEQFTHQWLSLEMLDILTVDREKHPSFNDDLKLAMHGEIVAFFSEILKTNRSILDFIESDYAVVNQRLAQHYDLPEVHGPEYQRVALRPENGRGGLLTQGGVLAMTSNGVDSNPLRRGVWLLENLLNDPPPPPPPAVPEIDVADPEIAKMTLKERLAQHRDDAACQSCHERIDPWGIAFENFDAIGNWRTSANNKPVDSHAILFNKQPLEGMEGLKRYLLGNRQDQFAESLTHKMTTFALGRPLSFGDRGHITQITADLRKKDDGLATLIHLIVQSEIFRAK